MTRITKQDDPNQDKKKEQEVLPSCSLGTKNYFLHFKIPFSLISLSDLSLW